MPRQSIRVGPTPGLTPGLTLGLTLGPTPGPTPVPATKALSARVRHRLVDSPYLVDPAWPPTGLFPAPWRRL